MVPSRSGVGPVVESGREPWSESSGTDRGELTVPVRRRAARSSRGSCWRSGAADSGLSSASELGAGVRPTGSADGAGRPPAASRSVSAIGSGASSPPRGGGGCAAASAVDAVISSPSVSADGDARSASAAAPAPARPAPRRTARVRRALTTARQPRLATKRTAGAGGWPVTPRVPTLDDDAAACSGSPSQGSTTPVAGRPMSNRGSRTPPSGITTSLGRRENHDETPGARGGTTGTATSASSLAGPLDSSGGAAEAGAPDELAPPPAADQVDG
jgi:hypothetical protein